MNDRYRRGIEVAEQLAAEKVAHFVESGVAEVAPEFARMVIEFAFGDFLAHAPVKIRLDGHHRSGLGKITVINPPRMLHRRAVLAVQAPVAGDQIHAAIAVEVGRRHTVPPAGKLVEG